MRRFCSDSNFGRRHFCRNDCRIFFKSDRFLHPFVGILVRMLERMVLRLLSAALLLPVASATAYASDQFRLSPSDLPAPHSTPPDDISPYFAGEKPGFVPIAPPGFAIAAFASRGQLKNARWLTIAPNGDVFVAESGPGRVSVLRDADGDGKSETVSVFAERLNKPHGMAFHAGALYVADLRAIWRFAYKDGDLVASSEPIRVTQAPDLRPEGWHWTREIAISSGGEIFLAIGARGDLLEAPSPDATVQEVDPSGAMKTYASGLRNVVGLAFYPGTNELWGTINERDALGGNLPPDYLAHIRRGDFFGWPYAYIGPHPDPVFGSKRPDLVTKTVVPDVLFEPHSAPLGLVFYDANQFPAQYNGDAFVAIHGSGPYGKPAGYKVVRVGFKNVKPTGGYEDFVIVFSAPGRTSEKGILTPVVFGTPAGLAVAKDGSLLIADENAVWRVTYVAH
jgi:glucose/arabinose dehydrogenase